jgi:hypothetical protein
LCSSADEECPEQHSSIFCPAPVRGDVVTFAGASRETAEKRVGSFDRKL